MTNTYFLVATAAFFWGANFLLGGYLIHDISPPWAAAFRFMLGALLMFVIAGVKRERVLPGFREHAATYAMLGAVGIVGFNLLFFYALRYTSANNAALIMATNPLLTTLLAAVTLRERPGVRHLLALPIALAGVVIVVTHGNPGDLLELRLSRGDVLMLCANMFWALYNVLCSRYMPQASPLVNITWIIATAAALLLALAIASGTQPAALGEKASISIVVMAIGGTVLAYLFWSIGIARLGAARTAIFLNLVPVFTMLLGVLIEDLPTAAQLVGGSLVLVGVAISMWHAR